MASTCCRQRGVRRQKQQSPGGGKVGEDIRTPSKTAPGAQRCWFNWASCLQHDRLSKAHPWLPAEATLTKLTDETKRPSRPREPLPRGVVDHAPVTPFDLDEKLLFRCLRSSRRGAAAGPSGMTTEHLRPLLDELSSMQVLFKAVEVFARTEIPDTVIQMVKMVRLRALSKPDGGVRGIVAGDVFRRLVARTMPQQLSTAVSAATAPHQYALSTRAGCECIAHALQGLTDVRQSRRSITCREQRGVAICPHVHGAPSEYLWEDSGGNRAQNPPR